MKSVCRVMRSLILTSMPISVHAIITSKGPVNSVLNVISLFMVGKKLNDNREVLWQPVKYIGD